MPLTFPQLLTHLEHLWGQPAAHFLPGLLAHIRHDVIALIEPVAVGAKMLVSFYTLTPEQRPKLEQVARTTDAWLLACRTASDNCLAQQPEPSLACECYLQTLGPIFANSTEMLTLLATLEATDILDAEAQTVLLTMTKSLERLRRVTTDGPHNDWTWLKEIFDEQERKRRNRK